MRTKKLLVYGVVGAAAYYLWKQHQAATTPAPVAAPVAPAVAGFGYFPSGSDRPFARIYNGAPTAWPRTHRW